jgi:hypothetical protein
MCIIAAGVGVLSVSLPRLAFLGATALFAGLLWVRWSRRHLLGAFLIALSVLILVSARFDIRLMGGDGTDSVFVSLFDPLWLGLLISFFLERKQSGLPRLAGGVLPYIALAIGLPLAGVLGGFPLTFITPSMRAVQWSSFAWMGYLLGKERGAGVFLSISKAILTVSLIHLAYALVQYGVYAGLLSRSLLALDRLYAATHTSSWFYYPRVTGMLVNPNSYGMYCAVSSLVALALLIARSQWKHRWTLYMLLVANMSGLLLSGSRTAILALLAGSVGIGLMSARRRVSLGRLLRITGLLVALGIGLVMLLSEIPGGAAILARVDRLVNIVFQGPAAEVNLVARMAMWRTVWDSCIAQFPVGTGVAPSHALGLAVDSYFVFSMAQGTILFTIAFLVMLLTVGRSGSVCWRQVNPSSRALGLCIVGLSLATAAGSLGGSPMLSPYHVIPLWSLAGLSFAIASRK